ncbi:hypothetical protein [Streptomyces sp. NPDC059092]|uniref:hypothetical protein n=1 Tax=Streptomyces sp. NPDC059092 TaxID=3346725 RepID=UPI0036C43E12
MGELAQPLGLQPGSGVLAVRVAEQPAASRPCRMTLGEIAGADRAADSKVCPCL